MCETGFQATSRQIQEVDVQVINGRYAQDPLLAHMLRCLLFNFAHH